MTKTEPTPQPSPDELTHVDAQGKASMVDIGEKAVTARRAVAGARLQCSSELLDAFRKNNLAKGDALTTARIAGIQAAKRCDELIPLCHSLPLDRVNIEIWFVDDKVYLQAEAQTHWKTGIEMEALTAVSVAALTLYDMGKAMDKSIIIQDTHLVLKEGGRSGRFIATQDPHHLAKLETT